jgi:tetratricopeptide (TPR) repeat protein
MYALRLIAVVRAQMDFLGRFYITIAEYHQIHKKDLLAAINLCRSAISLAISTRNIKGHCRGLYSLVRFNWILGDYSAAQVYASESQKLAKISADFYREALALNIKVICLHALGDYKQAISLGNMAGDLVGLCGESGGALDHYIMNEQAEVHNLKSEYVEAHNIHTRILQKASVDQDPYQHAFTLLNIGEIGVRTGAPKQNVERNIQTARELFSTRQLDWEVMLCEINLADLYLREGNI